MSDTSASPTPSPTTGRDGSPALPDHIGPYRILQVLGEGGMGVVYEAEQTTPVHRRVALKIVRAGLETRDVIARFETERQALAVMQHESIATVLEAGASETGQPYFVMELVRGICITDYCDSRKLSVRERVALFIQVCHGVQHAHQKGVIHRDLKPSNVLVTEVDDEPLPKIIDFGIAKAIGQRLTDATLVTLMGQTMGTPAYMSPEQAEMSGLDVDTRTDTYSLGVMLYELLVGRLPEDPQETGLPAFMMRLSMRETDPPSPSAKLTTLEQARGAIATLRGTNADDLRKQLRGDLDWIVMKAMDKDRNRRYQTVNGLAADLGRFLAHEPVQARPPTTTYRMRKFVRRHRVGVLAGAAIVVALLAGAAAATVGFVRATRANALAVQEAATARQVSSFLVGLFNVSTPDRARGNLITAREILDSGAVKLETDLADQPVVQARLMNTIGDVYQELGLYSEAERLLAKSLATRESLGGNHPADLAESLTSLGLLYREQGRYDAADSMLVRASALGRALPEPYPVYTRTLLVRSELSRERGRYAEADSLIRLRLGILERTVGPESQEVVSQLATLASMVAEQGRPAAAESLFRRILAAQERTSGSDSPRAAKAMSNLASSLFEQGKLDEADSLYRRSLAIKTRAYGEDHPDVALDLYNIANVENDRKKYAEAVALYQRAQAIWEKHFGPDHPYVGAALTSAANAYSSMGRNAEAVPLLHRAIALREKTLAPDHPFIATSYNQLGVTETRLGRYAEAEVALRKALAMREKSLEPTSYYIGETLESLADLYAATNRYAQADSLYRRTLKQWEASGREDAQQRREATLRSYAGMLRRQGRTAEAAALEPK